MTTNPTPIPEPTSPTAVVVGKRDGETVVAAVAAEINRLTDCVDKAQAVPAGAGGPVIANYSDPCPTCRKEAL